MARINANGSVLNTERPAACGWTENVVMGHQRGMRASKVVCVERGKLVVVIVVVVVVVVAVVA
jgi:hypothetical protein